jgi:hypothetical protein
MFEKVTPIRYTKWSYYSPNYENKEMSIRLIAKDLYRLQQEVERVEKRLEGAPYEKQADLKEKLRKLNAERFRMRRILDGQIDRS